MPIHLVVLKPFLQFAKGDLIADAEKVREILDSDHCRSVLKVGSPAKAGG